MKIFRIVMGVVIVLAVIGTIVMQKGRTQSNSKVVEANEATKQGNDLITQAGAKQKGLFTNEVLAAFPGNRETMKALSQETADLFGKAADQFQIVATKYDEASKETVGEDVVIEYWKLKAQAFSRLAEAKRANVDMVKLWHDETLADVDALNTKLEPLLEKHNIAYAEYEKIDGQAEKLVTDNKDKFGDPKSAQ